jgi:hypothetical protein
MDLLFEKVFAVSEIALGKPTGGYSEDYFVKFFLRLMEESGVETNYRDALIEKARGMGFFESPASARFHGSFQYGLPLHSIGVLKTAMDLAPGFGFDLGSAGCDRWASDMVVAALFHDLCKAGLYEVSSRNVKGEDGIWRKEPFYKVKDGAFSIGHGTESLRRVTEVYRLSEPWAFAVAWHMGSFGLTSDENVQYMNSCKAYREVLLLHTADMLWVCSGGA